MDLEYDFGDRMIRCYTPYKNSSELLKGCEEHIRECSALIASTYAPEIEEELESTSVFVDVPDRELYDIVEEDEAGPSKIPSSFYYETTDSSDSSPDSSARRKEEEI